MNRFKTLPVDVTSYYLGLHYDYDDIIHSCKAEIIDVCDNHDFWLQKMENDINNYNTNVFDQYEFLREALELRQYKYFEAILHKKTRFDDERINNLLFKYGFEIDNLEIMKHYAEDASKQGLVKSYEDPEMVKQILESGYFTMDEYYFLLSKVLEDINGGYLSILSTISLSVRIHPRSFIFNKLIFRYIGYKNSKDVHRFQKLILIYCNIVSTHKNLFNLMHDTYELKTIPDSMFKTIYKLHILWSEGASWEGEKYSMKGYVYDDLEEYKKNYKSILQNIYQKMSIEEELLNINISYIRNLVYNDSKCIEYTIAHTQEDVISAQIFYVSSLNLNLIQLKTYLNNLEDNQYKELVKFFILWRLIVPIHHFEEDVMRKLKMIIDDPRFLKVNIKNIVEEIKKTGYTSIDRHLSPFLKLPEVQNHIERMHGKINADEDMNTFGLTWNT